MGLSTSTSDSDNPDLAAFDAAGVIRECVDRVLFDQVIWCADVHSDERSVGNGIGVRRGSVDLNSTKIHPAGMVGEAIGGPLVDRVRWLIPSITGPLDAVVSRVNLGYPELSVFS